MTFFFEVPLYVSDLQQVVDDGVLGQFAGKSLLITGAYGLAASFIVDCLMHFNAHNDDKITVGAMARSADRLAARFGPDAERLGVTFHLGDVREPISIPKHYDYVIHAASNAHPKAYTEQPVETMLANLQGTLNILDYAKRTNTKKVMYFSSGEVYGIADSSIDNPLSENTWGLVDINLVRSAYPESKRAGEVLCLAYRDQYGLDVVSVRPAYVYGPTMTAASSKADSQFIRNGVDGEDIVLKSEGLSLRSYCYLSDFACAIFRVMAHGINTAYNIAGADAITIRRFAEIAAATAGKKVIFHAATEGENKGYRPPNNTVLSIARLEALGYKARIPADQGIPRTIEILRQLRYLSQS